MISAALSTRATWDQRNAALWLRCTDLLAKASHMLQHTANRRPSGGRCSSA
jgi:hypothetical protein